ncbi:Calmodulin-like protein 1 [Platanthera guangdongensis]|uniref:Calmodulin-like protein 1 n=1 Tax=Platanthera guangdongensis TaxID=2320717 RepID=A0ABR2MQP8_9ASPA
MSKLRILNFQYQKLKRLHALKPAKWFSAKDRQISDVMSIFHPNLDEMNCVFRKLDLNGDGRISTNELRSFLVTIGRENAAAEARSMIQVADLNKNGFIEFEEFMAVHQKGVTRSEIKMAFWMFDENKDGRIDAEEVMCMLRKLGETCSLEDCRRMVNKIDTNGDGLVDMDDFVIMMTRTMRQS